ncbi:Hypothetical predicted protein [Lecanosticta acicola]|uniref:Uncharacterized protein n=1 Tax=Lecanosticta acicola TaxID=111012 RepID=A0AAI8YRK4_9PEZI|nr:Hypothetical predicted protein [Lecanosticta acicola]
MPILDMGEMNIPEFDDGDFYSWDNAAHASPSSISPALPKPNETPDAGMQDGSGGEGYFGTQEASSTGSSSASASASSRNESEGTAIDDLIAQVTAVNTRASRATRQLHRNSGRSLPLMVNSPEINEAFETANALVQIVNNIPLARFTSSSSSSSSSSPTTTTSPPGDERDFHHATGYGLIFLALASHQHVLALFRAICASIQRLVGFVAGASEPQRALQPAIHGDEASYAQFVMVLQLIMHLVNRLDRSLQIASEKSHASSHPATAERLPSITHLPVQEPTPDAEGEQGSSEGVGVGPPAAARFVDFAQDLMRKLPSEHERLRRVIQRLQTHMEERLNA